jgi:hypothetical protein
MRNSVLRVEVASNLDQDHFQLPLAGFQMHSVEQYGLKFALPDSIAQRYSYVELHFVNAADDAN